MLDIFYIFLILFLLIVVVAEIWVGVRVLLHLVYSLRASVFEPSTKDKIETMLKLAQPQASDKIIDLGSGDGELLIAVAKKGLEIEGVELNPLLNDRAQARINHEGLGDLITIRQEDFLQIDLSSYDLLLVYCQQHVMKKLEKKLQAELKPGARVVSNFFHFLNWLPERSENQVHLYLKQGTA